VIWYKSFLLDLFRGFQLTVRPREVLP
jgi:hypothetical protein